MTDKYHESVKELITRNGAMGVNALSRELDIPLSTMQKYLEKQKYFVKTDRRQWDLPERMVQQSVNQALSDFDVVINSQLAGVEAMFNLLTTNIKNVITLLGNQKPQAPVAAGATSSILNMNNIDPRIYEINGFVERIKGVFKKQKDNIPEELRPLLFNFDYIGLVLKEGQKFANDFLEDEVYELLAGKVNILTEDTIQILKENQIGANQDKSGD